MADNGGDVEIPPWGMDVLIGPFDTSSPTYRYNTNRHYSFSFHHHNNLDLIVRFKAPVVGKSLCARTRAPIILSRLVYYKEKAQRQMILQ
jgi:hypothetical protein